MYEILPLYWLILGATLMILEIFIPTFIMLMSGISAVIVALLSWIFPLDLNMQMIIWIVLLIVFSILWFKYLKPLQKDKTKSGLGGDAIIGEIGMIVIAPVADKGILRFSVPLLGSDEWSCRSSDELKSGDRVKVVKIIGNELLVEKTEHQ